MNNFLIDKKFSDKYEDFFAEKLGLKTNKTNKDDEGIDIYGNIYNEELELYGENVNIDVKSYRRPLYIKHFKGVYIETLTGKNKNLGWYVKDNKTTHYIFVIDCYNDEVKYSRAFLIEKEKLNFACNEAIDNMETIDKMADGSSGFILPYKYLEKYGIELGV